MSRRSALPPCWRRRCWRPSPPARSPPSRARPSISISGRARRAAATTSPAASSRAISPSICRAIPPSCRRMSKAAPAWCWPTSSFRPGAPRDGTVVGMIADNATLTELLAAQGVRYHVADYSWIGRIATAVDLTVTWHSVEGEDHRGCEERYGADRCRAAERPRLSAAGAGQCGGRHQIQAHHRL